MTHSLGAECAVGNSDAQHEGCFRVRTQVANNRYNHRHDTISITPAGHVLTGHFEIHCSRFALKIHTVRVETSHEWVRDIDFADMKHESNDTLNYQVSQMLR